MKLVLGADVNVLASPRVVELAPGGRELLCAASALFACDFSGAVTRTLRKASGYGVSNVFVAHRASPRVVAISAGRLRVWSWTTAKVEREIAITERGAHHLASVTPDGSRAVTSVANRSVSVWDLERGKKIAGFGDAKSVAIGAAISRDGRLVAHGGMDGVLRIFDVERGEHVARTKAAGAIDFVARADDAPVFASGGRTGVVTTWNEDGTVARALRLGARVMTVAISPDGSLVAAHGSKGPAHLYERATGAKVATIDAHEIGVRSLRFSRDGARIATAGADHRACVFRIER